MTDLWECRLFAGVVTLMYFMQHSRGLQSGPVGDPC